MRPLSTSTARARDIYIPNALSPERAGSARRRLDGASAANAGTTRHPASLARNPDRATSVRYATERPPNPPSSTGAAAAAPTLSAAAAASNLHYASDEEDEALQLALLQSAQDSNRNEWGSPPQSSNPRAGLAEASGLQPDMGGSGAVAAVRASIDASPSRSALRLRRRITGEPAAGLRSILLPSGSGSRSASDELDAARPSRLEATAHDRSARLQPFLRRTSRDAMGASARSGAPEAAQDRDLGRGSRTSAPGGPRIFTGGDRVTLGDFSDAAPVRSRHAQRAAMLSPRAMPPSLRDGSPDGAGDGMGDHLAVLRGRIGEMTSHLLQLRDLIGGNSLRGLNDETAASLQMMMAFNDVLDDTPGRGSARDPWSDVEDMQLAMAMAASMGDASSNNNTSRSAARRSALAMAMLHGDAEPTYEELLELEDVRVTTSASQLQRIPQFQFQAGSEREQQCSICMQAYETGETLSRLPCTHCFHKECIEKWLWEYSRKCPICKHDME